MVVFKICGVYVEIEFKEDKGILLWSKIYFLFVVLLFLWYVFYNMEYFIDDFDLLGSCLI